MNWIDQEIAWLEEERKVKTDLLDLMEKGHAKFWTQELGKPMYETTAKDIVESKRRLDQIEVRLAHLRERKTKGD